MPLSHSAKTPGPSARAQTAAATTVDLFAAATIESFVTAVWQYLRHIVLCDYTSVIYLRAGNALLQERDSLGRSYPAAFMRRYSDLTPAIPLVLANPGIKVLPTRAGLPRSERALRAMDFYREVMKPQGWRHAVALCFWREPGARFPALVVTANRRQGRRDFSARDLARLEAVHPLLQAAVDHMLERSRVRAIVGGLSTTGQHHLPGILVLDHEHRVQFATASGRRRSRAWLSAGETGRSRSAAGLPRALAATCDDLLELWERRRVRTNARGSRLERRLTRTADSTLLTATVGLDAGGLEPAFVIELDERPLTDRSGAASSAAAILAKLTPAERIVAEVLSEGLSNQEIAERLQKTVHAVKFLLHRIYTKTGTANRTRLVAALRPALADRPPARP